MREAFEKVKAIIDGWDPVDLLTCCHCPSDEYDDISMELAQILTFDTDVETLKNDIYNIFVRDFDAGTFDKSPQECETIARKIIENTTSEATDAESPHACFSLHQRIFLAYGVPPDQDLRIRYVHLVEP